MDDSANLRQSMSDQQWYEALKRSIVNQTAHGIRFPQFPPRDVQERFVGSSFESALYEGFAFYSVVKANAVKLGASINRGSTFLDFGMGWGRYSRFFWKDLDPANIYGVDVHPDMVTLCRNTGVPGSYYRIEHAGLLPFPDQMFDVMIAYSVFTHLPEDLHLHWLKELSRVAKSGCVFVLTVEPPRFLDFCISEAPKTDSPWHKALARHVGDGAALSARIAKSEYVYIPTGGGDHLASDVYGDSIIPLPYIEKHWTALFDVHDYIDDPERFWQAVVVLKKR